MATSKRQSHYYHNFNIYRMLYNVQIYSVYRMLYNFQNRLLKPWNMVTKEGRFKPGCPKEHLSLSYPAANFFSFKVRNMGNAASKTDNMEN